MKITMVKKILSDGRQCKKCGDVQRKLDESGYIHKISRVIEADENDPFCEGMMLADLFQVDKAPFFIVEEQGKPPVIYTIYFKLVKEVLDNAAG